MMTAAVDVDVIRILLVVGVLVSSGCAFALLAGRAERRRVDSKVVRPALEIGSASAILAKASATAAERSSASRAGIGAGSIRPELVTGQMRRPGDRSPHQRESAKTVAAAIALHVAENDPKRMAEVITQWIRTDENGNSHDRR